MPGIKRRTPSRRKLLIIRYSVLSLGLVAALGGGVMFLLTGTGDTYAPGGAIEGITNKLQRDVPPDYPRVRFVDVAEQAGIRLRHFSGRRSSQLPEDMGSGAAWGDYDNDGFLDLYVCAVAGPLTQSPAQVAASAGGNRLFHNNGDGTFSDVTAQSGTGFKGIGMAAAWADYDGDGDLDLIVTGYRRLVLYRNLGGGKFEDVSESSGLSGLARFWSGASWADYDLDGDLDLYVCAYVKYDAKPEDTARVSQQYAQAIPFTLNPSSYSPEPNALFRNNGDGTFSEVSRQAGVENAAGRSLSASWCDLDRDGWLDLYIANDVSDNALYRNLGNGKFEDISHTAWAADYRGAMGLAMGDWDGDRDTDLFVTHWIAQENGFYWNVLHSPGGSSQRGVLRFTDIADMVGLGQISLNLIGWGTSFFDYDNDGKLDLFVANGSTFQLAADPSRLTPMRNHLYWQKSPEDGFFEVGSVSGGVFAQEHVGRGAAFADYDNDGDVDIVVVNHGQAPLLLRNDGGNNGNWLKVRLLNKKGHPAGIGATVEIETASGTQLRTIGAQSSYLSQNALEAHFGLGDLGQVDLLRVVFPGGSSRERKAVAANQLIIVRE